MDANSRRDRATAEATHWWTCVCTQAPAQVSETQRREFTQWLRESPLHVAELLHVAHVHDALERFKLWQEIPLETQSEDANVVAIGASLRAVDENAERPDQRSTRWMLKCAMAACVASVALSIGWLAARSVATKVETDRGERREIALADGSVLNLEPETSLRVFLGRHQRDVVLSRGRALFHVAKDSARPFIVYVGATDVRAVGTIFGVEQKDQDIIVTVSEGKVAVVPAPGLQTRPANGAGRRLSAGDVHEQLNYGDRDIHPDGDARGKECREDAADHQERFRIAELGRESQPKATRASVTTSGWMFSSRTLLAARMTTPIQVKSPATVAGPAPSCRR